MKKLLLFLSIFLVVSLACDLAVTIAQPTSPAPMPTNTMVPAAATSTQVPVTATSIPATSAPTEMPTEVPPVADGVDVFFGQVGLSLPSGLASGISGSHVPRAEGDDVPQWGRTPGHTEITLEGYLLQGKFHQARIYVYPAMDYVMQNPSAFESIHRLNNILYDPSSVSSDQLPTVPFFNAGQVFASNIQVISFQNGQGVRFLTEYAQYTAPVNNHELFYHFQGLTSDGEYYIIAILPVTVPVLADTSDAGAPLPPDGVPFPDITNPNADWTGYYNGVSALLNGTSAEAFSPTLTKLDQLIQSMRVNP